MSRISDTSPEAERVLLEAYRNMPFEQKWRQMGVIYRTGRLLHAAGVRQRNPHASEDDIREDWMKATLSEELQKAVKEAVRERKL